MYSHLSCCSVRMLTLTSGAELQHRTRSQLASNTALHRAGTANAQPRQPAANKRTAGIGRRAAGRYAFQPSLSSSFGESGSIRSCIQPRWGQPSRGPSTHSQQESTSGDSSAAVFTLQPLHGFGSGVPKQTALKSPPGSLHFLFPAGPVRD